MRERSPIGSARSDRGHFGAPSGLLQRKCACRSASGIDGEGAGCRATKLQRIPTAQHPPPLVPPIVYDMLHSPGEPLAPATIGLMAVRFAAVTAWKMRASRGKSLCSPAHDIVTGGTLAERYRCIICDPHARHHNR